MYKGYSAFPVTIPGSDKEISLNSMSVDDHFITLLGLQWKERPAPGALWSGWPNNIILNEISGRR